MEAAAALAAAALKTPAPAATAAPAAPAAAPGLLARQTAMMPARSSKAEEKDALRAWLVEKLNSVPTNAIPASLLAGQMTMQQRSIWMMQGFARGFGLYDQRGIVYLHPPPPEPPAQDAPVSDDDVKGGAESNSKPGKKQREKNAAQERPASDPTADNQPGDAPPQSAGAKKQKAKSANQELAAAPAGIAQEKQLEKANQKPSQKPQKQAQAQLQAPRAGPSSAPKQEPIRELLVALLSSKGGSMNLRDIESEFRRNVSLLQAWADVGREKGIVAAFPDLFCTVHQKLHLITPAKPAASPQPVQGKQSSQSGSGPRPVSAPPSSSTVRSAAGPQQNVQASKGPQSPAASNQIIAPAQVSPEQLGSLLQEVVTAANTSNVMEATAKLVTAIASVNRKSPKPLVDQVWNVTQMAFKSLSEKLRAKDVKVDEIAALAERIMSACKIAPFGKEGNAEVKTMQHKITERKRKDELTAFQTALASLQESTQPSKVISTLGSLRHMVEMGPKGLVNKTVAKNMPRTIQSVIDLLMASGACNTAAGRHALRHARKLLDKDGVFPAAYQSVAKYLHSILQQPPSVALGDEGLQKLTDQIKKNDADIKLSKSESQAIEALVKQVEEAAFQSFKREGVIQVLPFGSSVSGFAVKGSDVDICIEVAQMGSRNPRQPYYHLASTLQRMNIEVLETIAHARVPIVKIRSKQTGMCADVCVNNVLGTHNTALLRQYTKLDPRVRPLGLAVKRWAKAKDLNNPSLQSLSSYGYMLLVISYLQRRSPPVLPNIQLANQQAHAAEALQWMINQYCCWFNVNVVWQTNNKESLADLLIGFFKEYGYNFDYERSAVSIRHGNILPKSQLPETVPCKPWRLCIEDPFEFDTDCARMLSEWNQERMIEAMQCAHDDLVLGASLEDVCARVAQPQQPPEAEEGQGPAQQQF